MGLGPGGAGGGGGRLVWWLGLRELVRPGVWGGVGELMVGRVWRVSLVRWVRWVGWFGL